MSNFDLRVKKRNNVYSLYDVVAQELGPIFQFENDRVCERAIASMVANKQIAFAKDTRLVRLGYVDGYELHNDFKLLDFVSDIEERYREVNKDVK